MRRQNSSARHPHPHSPSSPPLPPGPAGEAAGQSFYNSPKEGQAPELATRTSPNPCAESAASRLPSQPIPKQWTAKRKSPDEKHSGPPRGSHQTTSTVNRQEEVTRRKGEGRQAVDRQEEVTRRKAQWTAKRKSPDDKHSGPPRGSHQTTSTVDRQEEVTRRKAQWTAKRKSPDDKHSGLPRGSHQTTSTVDRQEEVTRRQATVGHDRLRTQSQVPGSCTPPSTATGNRRRLAR